jgi:hypothetical protein
MIGEQIVQDLLERARHGERRPDGSAAVRQPDLVLGVERGPAPDPVDQDRVEIGRLGCGRVVSTCRATQGPAQPKTRRGGAPSTLTVVGG